MEWKETYPRKIRPAYSEMLDFLQPHIRELFVRFNGVMNETHGVWNKHHRYESASGWVYGFGRNYRCELLSVVIRSDGFRVLGVFVSDEKSLQNAFEKAKAKYDAGYEERYAAVCEKRRADQIARTKKRVEREKTHMAKITAAVNPETFNKFRWCKKVSRNDLLKLYRSEAKGMLDEELLDDIGYTFYTRCTQAGQARELLDRGKILCHHCGAVLSGDVDKTGNYTPHLKSNLPMHCACGHSYTYREYRRSFRAASMPAGRAEPIFERFAQKWPGCKTGAQKMILIDRLIHECHVTLMSGIAGRSVCLNLIEGSTQQLTDLVTQLAYANN